MTILSDTQYFNIRKELREKYFTDENFTQLTDIKFFRRFLKPNGHEHIGELSEYYFCIKYLVKPEEQTTLHEKARFDEIKKLKLILSNPNRYLNPRSNIQGIYDYLQELHQYNTEQWLTNRVTKILSIFEQHKNNLSISTKIENNQQLWV